jgi:hypothetical protein
MRNDGGHAFKETDASVIENVGSTSSALRAKTTLEATPTTAALGKCLTLVAGPEPVVSLRLVSPSSLVTAAAAGAGSAAAAADELHGKATSARKRLLHLCP